MPSPGLLRRVALLRTDVSEKNIASIVRVTRIGKLGITSVTSNQSVLQRNITAMWRNIPEDGFFIPRYKFEISMQHH
jgi:hypothetical protein